MMQKANGALAMWPGGEELFWVSAQALFVLMESSSAGFSLPHELTGNLADYLESRLESHLADDLIDKDGGETAGLACLALAKADTLKRSWLLRLEEIASARAKRSVPLSSAALAFLCEAVAIAGDPDAADRLYRLHNPDGEEPGVGRNQAMELSAWLMAALTLGKDDMQTALMVNNLSELVGGGSSGLSTRENSMALAALGRFWRKAGLPPEGEALIALAGESHTVPLRQGKSWDNLKAGARVEVENRGDGDLRIFWLAEGVPLSGKTREEDKGIVARRSLFDLQGREVAAGEPIKQGEVYEMRLLLTGNADDLVVVDLLPAGLEIEDASLKGRKATQPIATNTLSVKNVEIKDDRLLVFAAVSGSGEYRYLVRAVSSGDFVWPALDASRMYHPETRSVHGRNELKVSGGKKPDGDSY